MKLRSLYKSHWTCCRTLTRTKRTSVKRALWVVSYKSTSVLKWYLSATLLGQVGHMPKSRVFCIYCLETTTTSCSSSEPTGQPKVFQAIPNPKSSKISIFSCYHSDQSVHCFCHWLTVPNRFHQYAKKHQTRRVEFLDLCPGDLPPLDAITATLVIRKSAGWWRSTWAKWQVLRHERKPCVAR